MYATSITNVVPVAVLWPKSFEFLKRHDFDRCRRLIFNSNGSTAASALGTFRGVWGRLSARGLTGA
jgi:hypothetical protein